MSAPPLVRVRAVVHGRVQGVGYRAWCAKRASGLGLVGSVRNLADGTVEAVLEGDPTAVATMLEWCSNGPYSAEVTGVDRSHETPTGEHGFTIR